MFASRYYRQATRTRGGSPGSFAREKPRAQDDTRVEVFYLFVLHSVNQLKKLGAVHNFDEGLALGLVADYVNRRSVIDAYSLSGVFVLVDGRRQFALGIDGEGQIHFVVGGEFSAKPRRVGGVISG